MQYHTFLTIENASLPGIVVPQEVYRTGAVGEYPSIIFSDPAKGHIGVRLQDLVGGDGTRLDNAEFAPNLTSNGSARISIRIVVRTL